MAETENNTPKRGMEWLKERAAQAQKEMDEQAEQKAQQPKQMFLPGLDEHMRAMPNHVARSSLFAPVARGRKAMHDGTVLVSRGDAVIRFKGKQLDEAQADVWMQAMYEASKQPLGESVIINRAAFLKAIGRSTQGENYKWLHRTMEDLAFAMLVIEIITKDGKPKLSIGKTRALHMIEGFDYDDEAETYELRIDPRWHGMYSNREFALIDWDKRREFGRNQDMAKTLQRLIPTSADSVQRYGLDWLKDKMEYGGRMRDFRDSLTRAVAELVRLEIVFKGRIEDSTRGTPQLVLWLLPAAA